MIFLRENPLFQCGRSGYKVEKKAALPMDKELLL